VTLSRRDWVLVTIAVAFAAVCVRLGVWQLDRLQQRRARNAASAANRSQPAVELVGSGVGVGVGVDSLRERPIRARGVYDYTHERIWPARSFDGAPGVAILTPLRLRDGSVVFVDRGWVPSPDGFHIDLTRYREGDTVDVIGVGAMPPRGRGDVDPVRLRDSLPVPVLPIVVRQLPGHDDARVRRWPEPALSNGPHLGYAIQWFSFATIAIVGTVVLLKTSQRGGGSVTPGATPRG